MFLLIALPLFFLSCGEKNSTGPSDPQLDNQELNTLARSIDDVIWGDSTDVAGSIKWKLLTISETTLNGVYTLEFINNSPVLKYEIDIFELLFEDLDEFQIGKHSMRFEEISFGLAPSETQIIKGEFELPIKDIGLANSISTMKVEADLRSDIDQAILGTWMIQPAQIAELKELDADLKSLTAHEIEFYEDGTFFGFFTVNGVNLPTESNWNVNGNKMTRTMVLADPEYPDYLNGENSEFTIVVTADSLTLTDASGFTLRYSRKIDWSSIILGGWKIEGQLAWTFNADGTVVYDGYENYNFTWKIEGNRLTITDASNGEIFSVYDIKSLSSAELFTVDPEYPDFENKYNR